MREELRANPCVHGLFLSPLVMLLDVDAMYILLAQALFIAAWCDSEDVRECGERSTR
jgi:hypothetical protein